MRNATGYRDFQQAAAHGPRRFNAVAVYERTQGTSHQALRQAVGKLLCAVEAIELETLNVLVGIGWSGLAGHDAHKELADRHSTIPTLLEPLKPGAKLRVATPGDVIVQVAAETETDRLFALRLADALLAPQAKILEESLGVRRGVGREPFGYRDGRKGSKEYSRENVLKLALIESGRAAGGGWLLYQRFAQDVAGFYRLKDAERDDVMGISQNGEARGRASLRGHVTIAREYRDHGRGGFVRRGFPYREKGEEGLCFLALAAAPEAFEQAHEAMASGPGGADALLEYIEARAGGLYFAPPSAEWLAPGLVRPVEVPAAAKELERKAPLILAEVTPAALEYVMRARDLGAFKGSVGSEAIVADLRSIVDAVNWLISRQNASNPPTSYRDLTLLLARALAQANAVNLEAGEYITFDP